MADMWPFISKLLSKSQALNSLLGEVVFHTPREYGASSHSFFEWRVKESIDKSRRFIGVAMRADTYAGAEGSPTNYIQFDFDTAVRLRDSLSDCIEFMRQDGAGSGSK
jgi:hypothetical protein